MEVAAVLDLVRDEKAALGVAVLRDAAGEPIETVRRRRRRRYCLLRERRRARECRGPSRSPP